MADLHRRLLQNYLNTTITSRTALGVVRRSTSRRHSKAPVLVGSIVAAALVSVGYFCWKRYFSNKTAPQANLSQPGSEHNTTGPGISYSALRLAQLRCASQHYEVLPLRDVLLRLEENCRNLEGIGNMPMQCSPELIKLWDNAPEKEPKVNVEIFGCSMLAQLRLLAAQADLLLDETSQGVIFKQNDGLKQLPKGGWQRALEPEETKIWLDQQDRLRELAARWHLEQALGCMAMGSYQEAKLEAAKLSFLSPSSQDAHNLTQMADQKHLQESQATVPAVADSLLPAPPPIHVNHGATSPLAVRRYTLPQLFALHGLSETANSWSADGKMLTISENLQYFRIAECLVAALKESVQPIGHLQAFHLGATETASPTGNRPAPGVTTCSNDAAQKILRKRPQLSKTESDTLLQGAKATLSCGSAAQPLEINQLLQSGERLLIRWSFPGHEGAEIELPGPELSANNQGSSTLEPSQWLQIADPSTPGSDWLLHFVPAEKSRTMAQAK